MVDVAYGASGSASPKPGIAPQQANCDGGKLRVFISYSREDLEFADQLHAALNTYGFDSVIDRHGISGGEDWKRRLGNLIREADTVVFVLSPNSARSEICAWEVEEAERLGKRILPTICRPLEGVSPPPRLRDLNYILFHADPKTPGSGFGTGLTKLVAALNTDFDWLREHTRYLQRATEWDRGGRPANRLLSGDDIAEAKAWAASRPKSAPEPTALHLDFIRASEEEAEARSNAQRKQLEEMAAAQAERETALHEREEALKQAADAHRKRARIRNIALVVVSIFAVLANWLYVQADQQRKVAEEQRAAAIVQKAVAEEQRAAANEQKKVAEEQRRQADHILAAATPIILRFGRIDKNKMFAVFQAGANHGDATSMANLGILYRDGQGVARDYDKAREWFEKAVEKGDVSAIVYLGLLYRNGWGVARDYAKAREWFEMAVNKGDTTAMVELGVLYENGYGVTPDYAKSQDWYQKAAEQGNARAMRHLGVLYVGRGVAGGYDKAREWFEKAARNGDTSAMIDIGQLHENGLGGLPQDYELAQQWYMRAFEEGGTRAALEKLKQLQDKAAQTEPRVIMRSGQPSRWLRSRSGFSR
jgi:TPR repeat protein